MTKVKICGLTNKEHVDSAIRNGADFLGFVFAKSKRQIAPEEVARITIDCPKDVKKVGVFVSPNLDELIHTIQTANLDIIQLHGTPTDVVQTALTTDYFKQTGIESIQVLSGEDENLINQLKTSHADYILLDAPAEKEIYAGGNGKAFNWEETAFLLKEVKNKKVIIAGGLTKNNVKRACELFEPYAVDVSSGVETNGKKDLEKIREFISIVKEN